MSFPRDQNSHALAPSGLSKPDFDFHFQSGGKFRQTGHQGVASEFAVAPGCLHGHTELAASHLLFEGFDIGFLNEKKICDLGNDAGFVFADDGNRSEFFHGWLPRPRQIVVNRYPFAKRRFHSMRFDESCSIGSAVWQVYRHGFSFYASGDVHFNRVGKA